MKYNNNEENSNWYVALMLQNDFVLNGIKKKTKNTVSLLNL